MNTQSAPMNSLSRKRLLREYRNTRSGSEATRSTSQEKMSCTRPTTPLEKPKRTQRDLWAWELIAAVAVSWLVLGASAYLMTL